MLMVIINYDNTYASDNRNPKYQIQVSFKLPLLVSDIVLPSAGFCQPKQRTRQTAPIEEGHKEQGNCNDNTYRETIRSKIPSTSSRLQHHKM